ncbi:hypothetical protein PR003_g32597 [Phytophthora rubi]|uniref:Secreted protein n=1 Tax=Phytophthora rubi TaxID=129364 RepID=A0A6A3GL70_9STRA|nr:hypothetical protein PR001_g31517 [Phytophthora rubi]KAE8957779.1 hypothetical protein PR002_g31069 [Phytophthora rubi]KAE9264998.1 hypothetical protein PR003_g32597 [Phytophthora rubi]
MFAAAMLAVQQSLLRVPLCLPSSFLVSFDASLIWSSSASRRQCCHSQPNVKSLLFTCTCVGVRPSCPSFRFS